MKKSKLPMFNARNIGEAIRLYNKYGSGAKMLFNTVQETKRLLDNKRAKRSNTSKSTQTKVVKVPARARITTGYSGGRFKRAKRVKRNGKMAKMTRNGVQYTFEYGEVLTTTTQFQAIGHCNLPAVKAHANLWRLVLKKLLFKAGVQLEGFDIVLPLAVGDTIVLTYQIEDDGALLTETYTFASGNNLESLTGFFASDARGYYGSNTSAPLFKDMQYLPVAFNATTRPAFIKLKDAMLDIYSKSSLKIQNRSIQDAGDDEQSVDNVPLYGKSYEGTGNGTTWTRSSSTPAVQFHANSSTGVIKQTATALSFGFSNLGEPPSPVELQGAIKSGKVRIEPGTIKTSVLESNYAVSFQRFMDQTWYIDLPVASNVRCHIGKYRFMCLEKILDAETGKSITLAIEHNLKFVFDLREKYGKVLTQIFQKEYA